IPMVLLVIAAVAAIAALLGLFMAFTWDPCAGLCSTILGVTYSKPITLYLAAGAVLVGGAIMAYAAYMEYSKKAV
ncbi:MAG: hypothetical protein ABSB75_06075, partial [Candidatus Limnocylindrales bacterium]